MNSFYLNSIKSFEGFTPQAKFDYAQFSNGYGTRAKYVGEVIDKSEAERRFKSEITQARRIVDRHASHLDEGTKAALTSLTFNAGTSWIKDGLGAAIKSGDLQKARELFVQYNKAGGQVLAGLQRRRLEEVSWIGSGKLAAGAGDQGQSIAPPPAQQRVTEPANMNSRETQVASNHTDTSPAVSLQKSAVSAVPENKPLDFQDVPSGERSIADTARRIYAEQLAMLVTLARATGHQAEESNQNTSVTDRLDEA